MIKRLYLLILSTAISTVVAGCAPMAETPGKPMSEPGIIQNRYVTADGSVLPLRCWLPEGIPTKAVFISLHGFNDYSNAFSSSGRYLSSHGIACYAYDQRGFGGAPHRGEWAGTMKYTDDLSGFTKVIRKLHPDVPLYLLGESMGGAVAIVALTAKDPPEVDGAILVAPAVWGRSTMPWYQRWLLAVASRTVPWMELTGKGVKVVASDNIQMLRSLGRDPLVIKATRVDTIYGLANLMDEALASAGRLQFPALILYGKKDQVIPKEPTMLMLSRTPATTRKAFYDNGYHMLLRDLQAEKPLADIVAWVADHNTRLPNGKEEWN